MTKQPTKDDRDIYARLADEARQMAQTDPRHAAYWRDMERKAAKLAKEEQ